MLSSPSRVRPTPALLTACALGTALAVGLGGELSTTAHVAVLAAGGAVVVAGLVRRAGADGPPAGGTARPLVAGLVGVLAWEAFTLGSDVVPTISDLLDPVLAPAPVRTTATLAWLAAGSRLVARPGPTLAAAMRTPAGRVVVLAAWLWLGLHFLAR